MTNRFVDSPGPVGGIWDGDHGGHGRWGSSARLRSSRGEV